MLGPKKINFDPAKVSFDEQGLVPAILQDYLTGQVLMLGYMNKEALDKTLENGDAWFYSRKRKQLWYKGETSGNYQEVVDMTLDCDSDAILIQVNPLGNTCHLDRPSCFGEKSEPVLERLKMVLAKRYEDRPENSYTTYLFGKGIDKILKKVGEESAEVIIAAKNAERTPLAEEVADLTYHLMVMITSLGYDYKDVLKVLKERMK